MAEIQGGSSLWTLRAAVFIGLGDWLQAIGAVLFGVAWLLLGYAVWSAGDATAGSATGASS